MLGDKLHYPSIVPHLLSVYFLQESHCCQSCVVYVEIDIEHCNRMGMTPSVCGGLNGVCFLCVYEHLTLCGKT